MVKISALPPLAQIAADDEFPMHDKSTGSTKKATDSQLTGYPTLGWVAASATHTFVSFDSTTKIGVITIPAGGLLKYSPGMRYMFSQATGGTKYGIIHGVTDTTLTVFFGTDYTLVNQTITAPMFSTEYEPFGFPADPSKWTIEAVDVTARQGNTPTKSVWYVPSGSTANITIGAGKYKIGYQAVNRTAANSSIWIVTNLTLSTTTNSETNPRLTAPGSMDGAVGLMTLSPPVYRDDYVTVSSNTTFRILAMSDCSNTLASSNGLASYARVFATSAYI